MIRRWLRNWLGIQALENRIALEPRLVSREGKRIEPRIGVEQITPEGAVVTTISVSAPMEAAESIKKGYDAPI